MLYQRFACQTFFVLIVSLTRGENMFTMEFKEKYHQVS